MSTEGDYVDLTLVPEEYTGYAGEKAHRVWRSIYEENCFGLSDFGVISGKSPIGITLPDTMNEHLDEADELCLEKRVYFKIISGGLNICRMHTTRVLIFCPSRDLGLHASISTHICHGYLNQSTGERVRHYYSTWSYV